jgi:hypothetical protein
MALGAVCACCKEIPGTNTQTSLQSVSHGSLCMIVVNLGKFDLPGRPELTDWMSDQKLGRNRWHQKYRDNSYRLLETDTRLFLTSSLGKLNQET